MSLHVFEELEKPDATWDCGGSSKKEYRRELNQFSLIVLLAQTTVWNQLRSIDPVFSQQDVRPSPMWTDCWAVE